MVASSKLQKFVSLICSFILIKKKHLLNHTPLLFTSPNMSFPHFTVHTILPPPSHELTTPGLPDQCLNHYATAAFSCTIQS